MADPFDADPDVIEARSFVDRASGMISTLHLGPLDYNVSEAVDYLRTAAKILEEFGRKHSLESAP